MSRRTKRYGFWRFVFDFVFGICTGGIWWFYLGLRYLFKNS